MVLFIFLLLTAGTIWGFFTLCAKRPSYQAQRLYAQAAASLEQGNTGEARLNLNRVVTEFGNSDLADNAMLKLAELKIKEGDVIEAQKTLKTALDMYPDSDVIENMQDMLWTTNIRILFSPAVAEGSFSYEVQRGDSLFAIARKFNTTIPLIKQSNRLESSSIRAGDRLKIVKAEFSVIVDKSENTLILKADGGIMKVYNVSTGVDNCTPVGTFLITTKLENPVWYKDNEVVAAESPNNILGSRWMGLSAESYGIHGTTDPESIGKQVTEGCVRMNNKDVEELYVILPVGTQVSILD